MLISPTEPTTIKALGRTSSKPEQHGADLMWLCARGTVGVQRKAYPDFLASVQDGRLSKEVAQMSSLDVAVLVLEGQPKWTNDGVLLAGRGFTWTARQHYGLLSSIQDRGIWVLETRDLRSTVICIRSLQDWTRKAKHSSLDRRPKPQGKWGQIDHHDWAVHLLQSFEGVGPQVAEKIIEHFGDVPLSWTVTQKELESVPGVGKIRAKRLYESLANRN